MSSDAAPVDITSHDTYVKVCRTRSSRDCAGPIRSPGPRG